MKYIYFRVLFQNVIFNTYFEVIYLQNQSTYFPFLSLCSFSNYQKLHIAQTYKHDPVQHLMWGFALYASEGSMATEEGGKVRLKDLLDLILALVLRHHKKKVRKSITT